MAHDSAAAIDPARSSLPLPHEDWLREVLSLLPELLEGRCVEASAGVAIVLDESRYLILCRFGKPWLVLGTRAAAQQLPARAALESAAAHGA